MASFKGVNLNVIDTSDRYGLRLVKHEYPQRDLPFTENMGRKVKEYSLKVACVGDNWQDERDAIIRATQSRAAGTLIHPAYGTLSAYCESCSVSEAYVNGRGKCDIDLTFVESGVNQSPVAALDTKAQIRLKGLDIKSQLQAAFAIVYNVSQLPQRALDLLDNQVLGMVGLNRFKLFNIALTATELLNADVGSGSFLSSAINKYIESFRLTFLPDINNENQFDNSLSSVGNRVTPRQSILILQDIINIAPQPPLRASTASTANTSRESEKLRLFSMANATVEQAICSTYITYDDITQAEKEWTGVLSNFDKVIAEAALQGQDTTYSLAREMKSHYQDDIAERSPLLGRIARKSITSPIPSLKLAYDIYGDIDSEQAIIKRNSVENPAFIAGDNLTFVERIA